MRKQPLAAGIAAAMACLAVMPAGAEQSWNWFDLSNRDRDIAVTDCGYSDYLLDHTPGFEGREYLSGEWGGALGYTRNGQVAAPTWLEPRFSFPAWDANSNYAVLQPMTDTGPTAQGLPTARSVIGNEQVEITLDLRFVDTVTGIAMGQVAASAGGSGSAYLSNRYVLPQDYSFRNVSGAPLENLQNFQLLHGLTSQAGVYDDRTYAGSAMPGLRYGITLGGDAQSSGGQFDYIVLHSDRAPAAVELGHFGIEGVDDHGVGKPGVGTHLSIENITLNGVDAFAPAVRWVAGAQRWDLGTLAPDQSVSLHTTLAILTGWQVGGGSGGSGVPGASTTRSSASIRPVCFSSSTSRKTATASPSASRAASSARWTSSSPGRGCSSTRSSSRAASPTGFA